MRKLILAALTLPTYLVGYLVALLSWAALIAKNPSVENGVLFMTWRDWVAKRWRYSSTIAQVIFIHPHAKNSPRTRMHELVHVRQFEDMSLTVLVIGLLSIWIPMGVLWLLSPVFLGVSYLASALRHGLDRAYCDAEIERSAYSQTTEYPR